MLDINDMAQGTPPAPAGAACGGGLPLLLIILLVALFLPLRAPALCLAGEPARQFTNGSPRRWSAHLALALLVFV